MIVLAGILLPAFIMGYVEYKTIEKDILEKSHKHIVESTKLISQSLSRPLWDLSEQMTASIVHSSFSDDKIIKIKVIDINNNKTFYYSDSSKEKFGRKRTHVYYREELINFGPQIIGKLQVYYTVDSIYETLHLLLFKFCMTRLVQMIFTLIMILAFMNLGFLKRITRLSKQAKKLDRQILDEPFAWEHGDPIDELGLDLENARQSLNDLFREVRVKNDELFKLNQELENKVKEKTQQVVHVARMVALGEMAAGVAHEINNPLTVIMATAKYLDNGLQTNRHSNDELSMRLRKISEMGDRINKIVKGLRLFSGNTGKEQMKKVSFKLIFEETLVLCQEKLKNDNIKLYIVSLPDVSIECRSVEISQVLLNLINNASDAIKDLDNKWIAVEARIVNNMVEFKITDSGHGIEPLIAGKIMQPFFSTKPVDQGTGLGLSISSGIIEDHRGRLWLDQEAPHTTFVFNVPVRNFHTAPLQ
jgi:C4-dicarboxylate-specific signal transduction histidine kinase